MGLFHASRSTYGVRGSIVRLLAELPRDSQEFLALFRADSTGTRAIKQLAFRRALYPDRSAIISCVMRIIETYNYV